MFDGLDKFLVVGGRSLSDDADVVSPGRLFLTRGLATGKARVPIVDVHQTRMTFDIEYSRDIQNTNTKRETNNSRQ